MFQSLSHAVHGASQLRRHDGYSRDYNCRYLSRAYRRDLALGGSLSVARGVLGFRARAVFFDRRLITLVGRDEARRAHDGPVLGHHRVGLEINPGTPDEDQDKRKSLERAGLAQRSPPISKLRA